MLRNQFSLTHWRNQLSRSEALPQLIALGLMAGLMTGVVICGFRLAVDYGQMLLLPSHTREDFESLPVLQALALPIIGSLLIALLLFKLKPHERRTGPAHVLERMGYHQGRLTFSNLAVQFIGGAMALISGHSVGREGPSIHLGAGVSSLAGQSLGLSSNTIRLLVGCGTAAAIAAAFNTPLAGVIFAMEVIMLEYTVAGFLPIIAAAVAGDLVVRMSLGAEINLNHSVLAINTYENLPHILLIGLFTGILATVFSKLMETTVKRVKLPFVIKLLIAGCLAGAIGMFVPQVMGVGYDTLEQTVQGHLPLILIISALTAKLFLTPISLALGIPGGLIGPSFLIGALAGSLIGHLIGVEGVPVGYYAMIGMAAMTAALLHAPLAALMALLELSDSPHIVLPGMVAIIISCLVNQHIFKRPPIFLVSLRALGLDYRYEPVTQTLARYSVLNFMSRKLANLPRQLPADFDTSIVEDKDWIFIKESKNRTTAILPTELMRVFENHSGSEPIDLLRLPVHREDLAPIASTANLHETLMKLDRRCLNAACVINQRGTIIGVITRTQIESCYRSTTSPQ